MVPQPRKEAETKALYWDLVARLALRAIDEAFAVVPPALMDQVAFNGKVCAKDRATGRGRSQSPGVEETPAAEGEAAEGAQAPRGAFERGVAALAPPSTRPERAL